MAFFPCRCLVIDNYVAVEHNLCFSHYCLACIKLPEANSNFDLLHRITSNMSAVSRVSALEFLQVAFSKYFLGQEWVKPFSHPVVVLLLTSALLLNKICAFPTIVHLVLSYQKRIPTRNSKKDLRKPFC